MGSVHQVLTGQTWVPGHFSVSSFSLALNTHSQDISLVRFASVGNMFGALGRLFQDIHRRTIYPPGASRSTKLRPVYKPMSSNQPIQKHIAEPSPAPILLPQNIITVSSPDLRQNYRNQLYSLESGRVPSTGFQPTSPSPLAYSPPPAPPLQSSPPASPKYTLQFWPQFP